MGNAKATITLEWQGLRALWHEALCLVNHIWVEVSAAGAVQCNWTTLVCRYTTSAWACSSQITEIGNAKLS